MTHAFPIPSTPLPRDAADQPTDPQPQAHPASAGPLSPAHHAQIALAKQQRKKINRAQAVASFNAWFFAIFAGFSFLFAIFSLTSLIAAVALTGLAYNEFRGRRQLKQLDPQGPATLGINQLICCALLTLYCTIQFVNALTGPGLYAESIEQNPDIAAMLEPMQELLTTATLWAYALILFIGLATQGGTAWYYFTRKRHLNDYRQQTPDWVLDLERAQAAHLA